MRHRKPWPPHILSELTSRNPTYTENYLPVDVSTGILSQALKIDHNMGIYDTSACSAFTEIVVTNPEKPYVIVSRILCDRREIGT
jgi:hypothetical protein